MTIPDFQTLMLPSLQYHADGNDHRLSELIDWLADRFQLSDEDRRELLPSGRQSKFVNRSGWAVTYLRKAGLLISAGRGITRITDVGMATLQQNPERIDIRYLLQFPDFEAFRARTTNEEIDVAREMITKETETPEEVIEAGYQTLRRDLASELLDRVKACSPQFFEQLVVDLLVAMGYGGSLKEAGEAVGRSGDEGIDGIIKEDRLGLDVICIQAKRWQDTVGRPLVQAFVGSLEGVRARKGIFITTSTFTKEAREYANRIERKIVLIDGEQLSQYMIDYGIGVTDRVVYVIKRLDEDYFASG